MKGDTTYYIGLMTGTSVDQADAVLVRFSSKPCSRNDSILNTQDSSKSNISIIERVYIDFPPLLKTQIQQLCDTDRTHTLQSISNTNIQLTEFYASTVNQLLLKANMQASDIQAIGCHGQTIWHAPNQMNSWQLCEGNYLAAKTSIPVVTDFRQLDVVLDGQGAPLVPLFQKRYFQTPMENRVLLNLGGIANICVLPTQPTAKIIGFDTGPANTLLDQWHQIHQSGAFDKDGDWAASGQHNNYLLESLLSDSYFEKKAPKSTGREYFNIQWLKQYLACFDNLKAQDVQATLLELTAHSVVNGLDQTIAPPYSLFVFGGGCHNKALMTRIKQLLPTSISIQSTSAIGVDGDIMEALCFAWLAKQRLTGKKLNAKSITGSSKPHFFGTIYQP